MFDGQLSDRTINAYRRLAKPLAALMKLTRSKAAGPIGAATIARCNGVVATANLLFSREDGIGRVPPLPEHAPVTMADLVLLVDELMLAAMTFEARHPEVESRD